MPVRALIVAIEKYGQMEAGFSRELPGTHDSAVQFRKWLVEKKFEGKETEAAKHVQFLADDDTLEGVTSGATVGDFQRAVLKLRRDGQDQTPELYVFFSGHGFSFVESPVEAPADILVFADFADLEIGTSCLKLEEIQKYLWMCMGFGEHFFFLDACRNEIEAGKVVPGTLGLQFDVSNQQKPEQYTLYSTSRGTVASALSGFAGHLLKGLGGAGRAKAWRDETGDMAIFFDSLKKYVASQMDGQEVDARLGNGPGVLLTLDPPPEHECRLEVENASADDRFTVTVSNTRRQPLGEFVFSGPSHSFRRSPDFYIFSVSHPEAEVVPAVQPPTEMYDDLVLKFVKQEPEEEEAGGLEALGPADDVMVAERGGGGAPSRSRGPMPMAIPMPGAPSARRRRASRSRPTHRRRAARRAAPAAPKPPADARLEVTAAPGSTVEIRDLQFGTLHEGGERFAEVLPPGQYLIKMREADGRITLRREVTLTAGKKETVHLSPEDGSPLARALRSHYGAGSWHVEFSESVGPIAQDDLGVWLAVLGASRIVGAPGQFSRLDELPLERFTDVEEGDAPIYVLANLPVSKGHLRIGLSSPGDEPERPDWRRPEAVAGWPGLKHLRLPTQPGPWLLSLHWPKSRPRTFALHGLANRATLVTLSPGEHGGVDLRQFLLPLHALREHLDEDVRDALHGNQLGMVRYLAEAQRRFGRREGLAPGEKSPWAEDHRRLLAAGWLDPIYAVLAGYDLLRCGEKPAKLAKLVAALRRHYPELPDTEALAHLAGETPRELAGCPLLLEGLLALPEFREHLALPEGHLDFGGPWTAWQGAVATRSRRRVA